VLGAARSPPQDKKSESEQTVDYDWLRENYPILEKRAFNNPEDKDAVAAFLYARRILLDRSQRFDNAVVEMTRTDPYLNEFNRTPTFWTQGARTVLEIEQKAKDKAIKELAQVGGLLVFVDGRCRYCALQIPVLKSLRSLSRMEFMVISVDGSLPSEAKGEMSKMDNGLFRKLELKLTPSVVYVPNPKSYAPGTPDPNEYFVISQGYYGVAELQKMIAYSAFKRSKYLSAQVRSDLDIWNTGVASNQDLSSLKLDPNKPQTFKDRIIPMLQKQYPSIGGEGR
jgi:conjugal transfer pilus assembly protein TraF